MKPEDLKDMIPSYGYRGDFMYDVRPDYERPRTGIKRCTVINRNTRATETKYYDLKNGEWIEVE